MQYSTAFAKWVMEILNVPHAEPIATTSLPTEKQLEILTTLYREVFGTSPTEQTALKGDASSRCLYRFRTGNNSVIGVYGPNQSENNAFLSFTNTFHRMHLPVPLLLIANETGYLYLLEDLGDETLFKKLIRLREAESGRFPYATVTTDYEEAVTVLTEFQIQAGTQIDRTVCYQGDVFDEAAWNRDLAYFLDKFAELLSPGFTERTHVESEFIYLLKILSDYPNKHFLYRDFQSRNIMVTSNGLRFLDYQSGRLGNVAYDITSLLFDARADLPKDFRLQMFELHTKLMVESGIPETELRSAFLPFSLLRILQALGSYGNNGICNGHREHLASIPFGLRNALSVIAEDKRLSGTLQSLTDLLRRIAQEKSWEQVKS